MSHPIVSLPPLPSLNQPNSPDDQGQVHYGFNGKVMLAAMLILLIVILFVLSLHVYAKWFWRPRNASLPIWSARAGSRWRQRQRSLSNSAAVDETLPPTVYMGLDSTTINSLPTFIYQHSQHPSAKEPLLECAVCLSEFQPCEKGRLLPNCHHSFHIKCIDEWFRAQSTCPLCRAPVSLWIPEQHGQSMSTLLMSTASQGMFLELPSTPYLQPNEHTALQSSLQAAWTHSMYACDTQSIRITPPTALFQPNSAVQLQNQQILQDLAKDGNLTWKPAANAMIQGNLQGSNGNGMSESSSGSSTSAELTPQLVATGASIARCQSLGVPRCQTEDNDAGSPQQIKSRSFRLTIKRLLSRELSRGSWGRVFPTTASDVQAEQAHQEDHSLEVSSSSPL